MPGHSQTSPLVAALADIPETNLVPAQFLTGGSVFTYYSQNNPTNSFDLPRLHIDMTVNANPANNSQSFRVIDDMAFGNGARQ